MAYKPGECGNKAGRPKGIVDRRVKLRKMIEPHAGEIIKKLIELAKGGDLQAMKMILDRTCPTLKPDSMPLQANIKAGTLSQKAAAIFKAATNGRISPDDATALITILQGHARIIEVTEILDRLAALENAQGEKSHGK